MRAVASSLVSAPSIAFAAVIHCHRHDAATSAPQWNKSAKQTGIEVGPLYPILMAVRWVYTRIIPFYTPPYFFQVPLSFRYPASLRLFGSNGLHRIPFRLFFSTTFLPKKVQTHI